MTDNFDSKKYKEEFDKIELSKTDKDILKARMYQAEENENEKSRSKKQFFTVKTRVKIASAAVAAALIAGVIFIPSNIGGNGTNSSSNAFTIVANAAEYNSAADNIIGLYSGSGNFGPIEGEKALNESGKTNYSASYNLSNFAVKGENIKSVTVKSNTKYCYFSFSYSDKDLFSNYKGLKNSQYSQKQRNSFYSWSVYCDSVTYNAEDDSSSVVTLNNLLDYEIETNRTDEQIDKWLDKYEQIEEKLQTIRAKQHQKYGDNVEILETKKEIKLEATQEKYWNKAMEKILKDASFTLTVNFADGTSESVDIYVDYLIENVDGSYCSVSEYYSESQLDIDGMYGWIALKYSE